MQSALFENILLNASRPSVSRSAVPPFLYGCAWKKEHTSELVYQALSAGFRGIDVAAQPKHYREDLAGAGLRRAIAEGKVKREDLFIQTKFTPIGGQDLKNMPYDPEAPLQNQVETSIASSLKNLRHSEDAREADKTYIDSLVFHSPLRTLEETKQAWKICESYVPHKIRNLGISNTTLPVLQALYDWAEVKPSVVQNRFYRDTQYEQRLRKFCQDKGIVFQSFWTLTANPGLLKGPPILFISKRVGVEPAVALYSLILGLPGTICLNGTSNHMISDLEGMAKVREWALKNQYDWENQVKGLKDMIGDNI